MFDTVFKRLLYLGYWSKAHWTVTHWIVPAAAFLTFVSLPVLQHRSWSEWEVLISTSAASLLTASELLVAPASVTSSLDSSAFIHLQSGEPLIVSQPSCILKNCSLAEQSGVVNLTPFLGLSSGWYCLNTVAGNSSMAGNILDPLANWKGEMADTWSLCHLVSTATASNHLSLRNGL